MGSIFWISVLFAVITAFLSSYYLRVNKHLPRYKLAIGILSSRENFMQRAAIRSTWLSVIGNNELSEDVFYSFVVANKDCPIPASYRLSEYSCEEQRKWPEDYDLHNLRLWKNVGECAASEYPSSYGTVAFDFTVIFDVLVTGFAVPAAVVNGSVVQLWNLASDMLVVEATVSHGTADTCWQTGTIHPHVLPKGFVGSLMVTCADDQPCIGLKNWFTNIDLHPVVEISPVLRYSNDNGEHVIPMTIHEMLLPAMLLLDIPDIAGLKQNLAHREKENQERLKEIKTTEEKLQQEFHQHGDLLTLPDVQGEDISEVYTNLARKQVSFHHWCSENINAEFIMKTDDDSYVDVQKVLQSIKRVSTQGHNSGHKGLWLGHFRRHWPVDRWGKWAEYKYTAPIYPDYACGAGNVVSSELSQFLANNRKLLSYYQGEDVSSGIWFAAINPRYVHDARWICNNDCRNDMVVSTQHAPSEILGLWENKLQCGVPCGCI